MTWFFIAIIGPVLYAITNHIDKHLLTRYFQEGGVGTLMLFSSLLSILLIPFVLVGEWIDTGSVTALSVGLHNILILSTVGILNISLLWFYLKALEDDEASITVVFYQLIPVFGLVLGYIILHEVITTAQLTAMAIVIVGTSIISVDLNDESKLKIRTRTVAYMSGAALCWALGGVIFKAVALEENVWASLFWEHVMLVLVGIVLFSLIPTYRQQFITALRVNSKSILSLNVTNEAIYMTGNAIVAFAYLMAPIALVLLAESFQPIFTLIIGIFLTLFLPELGKERIDKKTLIQKVVAISITGVGTYILLSVS